ncbi:PKD domain-containing protein [Terrimonas pollutisoli]|uniref:PKD domain-containing protein n=1 Tax=Terrimonas pollutisoli TaxID=3034147 RepID=UPI0023ED6F5B|nr:PKD domain-containing protein [Terrimonas sp. H1YJ31]
MPHAFGQNPVANFTANTTSGCAPLAVKFTDQSSGSPTEWNWEFSNGTLSNAQNPTVSFATPGTYSVKLVVRNANGIDQIEKIDYITVYPSPIADFDANIRLACVPATVRFTDLSSSPVGTIASWEWEFGDGGTSSQQNPSHTYATTGFYTVTLKVISSNGCERRISRGRYIRVVDGVETNFNFSDPSSCKAPFAINFQNQSSGPGNITYTWNFGNGQTSTVKNPTTIYNAPGTYNVRLNARSDLGCSGSIQKDVTITQTNTDFSSPSTICLEQPVTFQNNSSAAPATSSWNFGDGTMSAQINPIKTFLTAGTYNVKLINNYSSCTDSITKTVTVINKPVVNFTANDSASCQAPFNVQFTDMTPGATSWLWDFGDGTTSSLQNPTHQYNSLGNYTVTLTAGTSADCASTITKTDLIKIQETTVSINRASGCIPFTYTPKATIQTLDSIATYLWDFGDGTTSNVKSPPPHSYPTEGKYTVSLTITTVSGCAKTVTVPNTVVAGTPAQAITYTANPTNACASETISFSGQAITSPGADVEWNWDFGDGTTGSGQNTTHLFKETGILTVTLTVSNNGCPTSYASTVTIRPPIAKFEYSVNCANRSVSFNNTSSVDAAVSPLTYLWQMGDPANTQFTVATPPLFTYPGPGTYNVTLTITNGTCTHTVTKPVTLVDEKADFTINENPVCKNSVFTLSSINNNANNITNYEWTVGSTILAETDRSVRDRLSTNGTYDVSLTITDINGCTNTKTVANYITVYGPSARFEPATTGGCLNKAVTFNDLSTPAPASAAIVKWEWNFGDSTPVQTFNAPPFTHVYTKAGRFPVTLVVTDANGCTDRYRLPGNLLITNPQVGFRADTFYCPQSPLQFADTSSGAGLKYLWEFGDGSTSNLQNPRHSYPAGDAVYSVKLKITDISGCEDSITKNDYIKIRSPKAAFDIQDTTTICPPLRTTFTFKGSDYKSFRWVFGDGGSSTLQNPSYFYGDYGHYTPKLYLTGPGGCVDSAQASVSLYDPEAFTKINYGLVPPTCNSLNVDFNLVVPPSFKFIFYFGDGAADSSGATTLSHFYSRPSFNRPRIEIIDTISGCRVVINGRQRIDILGAIPLFGKDKKEFCDQGVVNFKNFTTKNDPIISTVWTFGDNTTSTDLEPSHNFTQPGTYVVTLTVTTQNNCTKSFSDTVFVYRTPTATIQSRDTICLNIAEPINGVLTTADTLTKWQWNFGNGQSSSQQNNSVIYNASGSFPIQLVTSNKIGCSSTATKNIYVAPLPTAIPVQEPTTIIVGSGANILMNYTGNITSYNWMPATNLSCTDCPSPYANPRWSTKYTVQIEDSYGCKNSGDVTVVVVCNNQNFFIPNTFSPNGDGRNEVFYPKGTGLFRIKSMRIFNRWGQVVFEKKDFAPNDPSAGWNGMYDGKPASPDAYIYTMEILCDNNTVIPVKGNVTLLR